MVAVPGQQIATVSRKLIKNPIKCVNVVSSKQTAPAWHSCHTGWRHTIKNNMQLNVGLKEIIHEILHVVFV